MSKTSIKIIKRKDAETMANARAQKTRESKQNFPVYEEKAERRAQREIVAAVSNWITERTKNNRAEQINSFRKLSGNKPALNES